jgi:NAD(P)-dependent dehydrogenase (short-subunit alcohol dehydrogenase family)
MEQRSDKLDSAFGHVVVTGAGRGIGQRSAIALARAGFTVSAAMRDLTQGTALKQVAGDVASRITPLHMDVTSDESVLAAITLAQAMGPVAAVVNNAAIMRRGPIETLSDRELSEMVSTNLFGPLRVMRAVIPHMREHRAGVIVNVSSAGGYVAAPFQGAYAMTKHALEALSMSARAELAPFGIRVVSIEPGQYDTPMRADHLRVDAIGPLSPYRDVFDRWETRSNRATSKDPDEVANAIVQAILNPTGPARVPVGTDAVTLAQRAGRDAYQFIDINIDGILKEEPRS